MNKLNFTKMVASGNDFVVIDKAFPGSLPELAKKMCDRKFGIGADGLLVLGNSRTADIRMRIFNADGSEAAMCGNGARCAALYAAAGKGLRRLKIETKAGIILAEAGGDNIKIKLTGPKGIKLNIPIIASNRNIKVNFINTGVPHVVIFIEGLEKIDVFNLGREIRNHKRFAPAGANVNFIEVTGKDSIKIRTYERGVEDETLACGTGSTAAALITAYSLKITSNRINVLTKSGEALKVYFIKSGNNFSDVWLEGKAKIVYGGTYNV